MPRKGSPSGISTLDLAHRPEPLPRWIVSAVSGSLGRDGGGQDDRTTFAAGAAVHAIDLLLRAEPTWLGCWRMRLVLKAAVSAAALLRIDADETTLRDVFHLTRAGDDPGPAGRLHALIRRWSMQPVRLSQEGETAVLAEAGQGRGASELAALLAADRDLAAMLGWSTPLPLHLTALHDPILRRGREGNRPWAGEGNWNRVRHAVVLAAAVAAHAEAVSLGRRAGALADVFTRLRTREGGEAALQAILSDDSVAPWRMAGIAKIRGGGLGSDRSARRFCESLHAAGTLRLLTMRPTHRVYGL